MFLEWWMILSFAFILFGAQLTSYRIGVKDCINEGMELTLLILSRNGHIEINGEEIKGIAEDGS